MAKTWVLDTETKGTGAEMVPLDKVLRERQRERERANRSRPRRRKRGPRPAPRPERRKPRTFKVVDVVTGRVLGEGLDARAAVGLLAQAASMVDVDVSVWQPQAARWRRLTHREKARMWRAAHPRGGQHDAAA
jgi:hypothetical protein